MLNPFSLPIHPAIVHFPIAMLSAAWVCVLLRYATGDLRWHGGARLFELVGVVGLPVTIAAAFVDTRGFNFLIHPRTEAPLIWHMTAGLVTAAVFGSHYLWRRRRGAHLRRAQAVGDIAWMTCGIIALLATTLISAEMVYGT
jgi:uncharacterized membrane protein